MKKKREKKKGEKSKREGERWREETKEEERKSKWTISIRGMNFEKLKVSMNNILKEPDYSCWEYYD